MKKSKNTHETFKQYLTRLAVVTNKSTYAMDARNILKCFKHTGIEKMREEKVSSDLIDVLEITYAAWKDSRNCKAVDPCSESAGWVPIQHGCHMSRVHLGI